MTYDKIVRGTFLKRINRFIAFVEIDGKEETVHVKNTGRCKELLIESVDVYLQPSDKPDRKTKYDLVAVVKNGNKVVNIDSQMPNKLVVEWLGKSGLFSKQARVKQEKVYGKSRFDVYVEDEGRKAFIEVKGVTLENDGVAMFPDAPTERGTKHLYELMDAVDEGYEAYIIFVIQLSGTKLFSPNRKTDERFARALKEAESKGVKIIAVDCVTYTDSITIDGFVDVRLD